MLFLRVCCLYCLTLITWIFVPHKEKLFHRALNLLSTGEQIVHWIRRRVIQRFRHRRVVRFSTVTVRYYSNRYYYNETTVQSDQNNNNNDQQQQQQQQQKPQENLLLLSSTPTLCIRRMTLSSSSSCPPDITYSVDHFEAQRAETLREKAVARHRKKLLRRLRSFSIPSLRSKDGTPTRTGLSNSTNTCMATPLIVGSRMQLPPCCQFPSSEDNAAAPLLPPLKTISGCFDPSDENKVQIVNDETPSMTALTTTTSSSNDGVRQRQRLDGCSTSVFSGSFPEQSEE